jgi:ABC-2 type transport system permease protein
LKAYLALISIDLRLALRQRSVIFFNFLFPLMFFIIFAEFAHGSDSGAITRMFALVVVLGVLTNGLMGAGIRAVQEREANILRRYKVTPISPVPLLTAATITGWVLFLPFIFLLFALAHFGYGMDLPANMVSITIFLSFALLAFRAIGMIIAAAANSAQESQILVQIVLLPMLILSGATFPISLFPAWLQNVVQFLPATYLVSGLEGMLLRNENIAQNGLASFALILTVVLGLLVASKLFRWEKEEKINPSAKFWIAGILLPFIVLGAWQSRNQQNVQKAHILARQLARNATYLIRDARIFVGDGRVIANGAVLVRNGKIIAVYESSWPDAATLKASPIEAAGKTLLPGLIDTNVHLAEPGGFTADKNSGMNSSAIFRRLAAYLYSGVTTVRSDADPAETIMQVQDEVNGGAKLGAETFTCGPVFTPKGSYQPEYFSALPSGLREQAEVQFVRSPASAQEAGKEVAELKTQGVNCIAVNLDSGFASNNGSATSGRFDLTLLKAIIAAAHMQNLHVSVHTGNVQDVTDAVTAGADCIEHGSSHEIIPDALLDQMARQKTFYDPTLSEGEALKDFFEGNSRLLQRSLVQQVGPADMLATTENILTSPRTKSLRQQMGQFIPDLQVAKQNLLHARSHGVPLVMGSGAGSILVIHGPTVQHEAELWLWAGLPASVALQASTENAALLLHADNHIGRIRPGNDADLLLVDGNPLDDISSLERISAVFFQGERLDRSSLLSQ